MVYRPTDHRGETDHRHGRPAGEIPSSRVALKASQAYAETDWSPCETGRTRRQWLLRHLRRGRGPQCGQGDLRLLARVRSARTAATDRSADPYRWHRPRPGARSSTPRPATGRRASSLGRVQFRGDVVWEADGHAAGPGATAGRGRRILRLGIDGQLEDGPCRPCRATRSDRRSTPGQFARAALSERSGHDRRDRQRRVGREVERRRGPAPGHQLGAQRGDHRAVVGAQPRPRDPDPDPRAVGALLGHAPAAGSSPRRRRRSAGPRCPGLAAASRALRVEYVADRLLEATPRRRPPAPAPRRARAPRPSGRRRSSGRRTRSRSGAAPGRGARSARAGSRRTRCCRCARPGRCAGRRGTAARAAGPPCRTPPPPRRRWWRRAGRRRR